jgi:putative ABC transport system substrate-binding protein
MGLGGVAAMPLPARTQERVRRLGVLMGTASDDPLAQVRYGALVEELKQLGWVDGRNIRIDTRFAAGDVKDIRKHAAQLVAATPDVIVATGSAPLGPLSEATRTLPIVFTQVPDPVGAGYAESMARPGGNITGFTPFEFGIVGKWLELLKEVAPHVTRAAIVRDAAISAGLGQWGAI